MAKELVRTIKKRNKIIDEIINILLSADSFIFISYIDPDALGSMLSLGLILKGMGKDISFYLPDQTLIQLEYFENIIKFNNIRIIENPKDLKNPDLADCLILNDTANKKVIPHYKTFQKIFNSKKLKIIEIDHHFGTDADRVSKHSVTLFEKANANCEIITKILYRMDKKAEIKKYFLDKSLFKRNIVLSLLTGIISDTQFGKYLANKSQYEITMKFLSLRLELQTIKRLKYFHSPKAIYKYLVQISEENEKCINQLLTLLDKRENVFILDISDNGEIGDIHNLKECKDTFLEDISDSLANKIPELHSKIGIFILEKELEGNMVNYIKIRRSMNYKGFNIKTLEPHFKEQFNDLYLGGGGHEGACSFRVKKTNPSDFYKRFNKVIENIQYND